MPGPQIDLVEAFVPGTYYFNRGFEAQSQGRYFAAFGWHTAGHVDVIGSVLTAGGGVLIGATGRLAATESRIVFFTQRSLQKGFTKHGADFGLTGNWNPSRAADFSLAVHVHINSPGVVAIGGTYRGMPVTHFLNPLTGVNVIVDQSNNYISGWRLGWDQLNHVLTTGSLR